MAEVTTLLGSLLLLAGAALVAVVIVQDLVDVPVVRGFERPIVLVPAAVLCVLAGGVLLAD